MEALNNIYEVVDNQITIKLPEDFDYKSVQVIVLPIFPKKEKNNKEEILNDLLNIPTWTEDELKPIIESEKFINEWKPEEF